MNTRISLVVPDLFLAPDAAAEACADLRTPALGRILARAQSAPCLASSLEEWLCTAFGVESQGVAPIMLQADGMLPGASYWLRADPVHLALRGDRLVLRPIAALDADEAAALCDSLSRHFAGDGLQFFAPRPEHWYLRVSRAPEISTHALAQVAGKDMYRYLPQGREALQWHRLLNEIQMLLFAHPVNAAREARGEWPVNGVWLWGGGYAPQRLLRPFERAYTDNALAGALAAVAGAKPAPLPSDAAHCLKGEKGAVLIVWDGLSRALEHGDLGEWHDSVERFERHYAAPLLQALRSGRIESITLDGIGAHGSRCFALTRGMAWQIWRPPKRLERFAG